MLKTCFHVMMPIFKVRIVHHLDFFKFNSTLKIGPSLFYKHLLGHYQGCIICRYDTLLKAALIPFSSLPLPDG